MANDFCWYELMTTDRKAAAAFYESVVGWRAHETDLPGMPYTLLSVGAADVAGMMDLSEEACKAGARPGWIGYIAVDNVDTYSKRVTEAGGSVHRPPADIPNVGRFAVVADPHGAAFVLFTPGGTPAARPEPRSPGTVAWHELMAGDGASAFAFYSGLFGWSKSQAMDMGPMGTYQLFNAGKEDIGGIMTKMPEIRAPFWTYYVVVEAIDAATARVQDKGGKVLNGPMQVPGGSWIVQCLDPQGAMFALTAMAK